MKLNVRLRECEYVHCSGCGAVRCTVVTSCVQCLWFWCLGRCEVSRSEGQAPPDPKGWTCAAAAPDTLADLLGARAERVPDCSSYLSRIPGSAKDSGSSIHPRDSRGSPGGKPFSAPARASPRLIKGLETFPLSKLRWSREEPVSLLVTGLTLRALNSAGIRARSEKLACMNRLAPGVARTTL